MTDTNTNTNTNVVTKKEELIQHIKDWIKVDNEVTKLKAQLKEKNAMKKALNETLVQVMKHSAIDCFDINGGALLYKKRKTKKGITSAFLLKQLEEYYKDTELAKEITKKVWDSREEVLKEEIKRKIKTVAAGAAAAGDAAN